MAEQMDSKKLKVKCTYGDCSMHFPTEREMKQHKKHAPEHHYCKKCDVDCKDWEDLTKHKVDAMWPWLDGRMKGNKDEQPMHIVCEFCGEDFKSFGGRKRHRDQNHKADQHIVCPGCHSIFTRAGNYVEHLEKGHCTKISRKEFLDNMQQKHLVERIMANKPNEFGHGLLGSRDSALPDDISSAASTSEYQEIEDGGVPLIDQEYEDQKQGYLPLNAQPKQMNAQDARTFKLRDVPQVRRNLETWPRLPGLPPSEVADSLRTMSISSPAPSIADTEISASEFASSITSRRGGIKVYTESNQSLGSPFSPASIPDYDDTASEATATTAVGMEYTSPWGTGKSSQLLFKDAKPTPRPGDWQAWREHDEQELADSDNSNLFHTRFWDRSSSDYVIPHCYNPLIDKYCCPMPECEEAYKAISDLDGHLQIAHLRRNYRCPLCLKIFKTAHALVSHSEGGGCRVKDSKVYGKLLEEISGGYLDVEHLRTQKAYKTGPSAGKKAAEGVMSERFEAKLPDN